MGKETEIRVQSLRVGSRALSVRVQAAAASLPLITPFIRDSKLN